jgi:HD-GYP domain-containing protein (c-di-GMP phosphodiesterase class II)
MKTPDPAGAVPAAAEPSALDALRPGSMEEVAATQWIFEEAAAGRKFPVAEAECLVNAMHGEQKWGGRKAFPMLPVGDPATFLAIHAVNVSTMAMALAASQQFDQLSTRRVGLAALLYDVGMARLPTGIVLNQGKLSAAERSMVKRHPIEGARLLLASDESLDLAAVVAYEHHLRMDGSGYPTITYPRSAHYVSRLIQVCDVFCALGTDRPYRNAWPMDVILSFLEERAGFEFHPTIANALVTLVRDELAVTAL